MVTYNNRVLHNVLTGIFLIIVTQSCVDNRTKFYNEDGLLVKRTFYQDGSLQTEATYEQDSIRHGYAKLFYPDGTEKWYVEYDHGKKNGVEMSYYNNGKQRMIAWNWEGKPDSTRLYYDSLGKTTEITHWRRGLLIGEQRSYYPTGKLKECSFYDPLGRLIFRKVIDLLGMQSEEGTRRPQIVMVTALHSADKWKLDENFKARIYICKCGVQEKWTIQIKNRENGQIVDSHEVGDEVNIIYSWKPVNVGSYEILVFNEIGISSEFYFSISE